ncbi:MAG: insulinase family protein [Acidimicrobiia bacterium]|nr:insulinase family protein [Acidimicrobiia bacterium]
MNIRLPLAGICVAALVALPLPAQEAFTSVQSRVSEFTLANGLKFLVMERHQAPVVSFYTYADVGSAQEVKGITGLAHMFEHMAFKGTDKIGTKNYAEEKLSLDRVDQAFVALQKEKSKLGGPDKAALEKLQKEFDAAQEGAAKFVVSNEFSQIIDAAGGRGLNATTAADRTDYFYSLPSNALELWFYLESERFLNPVLRDFYKEAGVVREERRMRTENNPIGKLLEEFKAVAYKAHPYGEPEVGHMSDLESFTRMDAEEFFRKYYGPSNLTIAVVGDVDPKRVKQLAESYFGRLQPREKPMPLRTMEPEQTVERSVTVRAQAQRIIVIGYHKPSITHPDHAVYEAISSLLSAGRSSRMHESLVTKKKVAVQAGGFPGFPGEKYPGLFLFFAVTAPGKTNEDAEKEMMVEINRLKDDLPSKEELEGVKNRARAGLLSRMSNNSNMAQSLVHWQALTGDWRNLFKYLDRINAVTPEDVQRVAKATFTESNRTTGYLEPAPK